MDILIYPSPGLRKEANPVEAFDEELEKTASQMLDFMYRQKGVGLAGPQVGISKRLFVINPNGDPNRPDSEIVIVNPKILKRSGEAYGEEGCLSFPGIYGEILRATWIRVQAQTLSGQQVELEYEGFDARVIQHEMDHLMGILFVDRLEPAGKLQIRKALERLEKKYKET